MIDLILDLPSRCFPISLVDIEVNHLRCFRRKQLGLTIKDKHTTLRLKTIVHCLDEGIHRRVTTIFLDHGAISERS